MTIAFRGLLGAAGVSAEPPPAFSPSDLTGLGVWLDWSDASTVSLNGNGVSQVDDKSGNGRHFVQATALSQPEYVTNAHNGLAVARFNGSKTMACVDGLNLLRNVGAVTLYAVVKAATITTDTLVFRVTTNSGTAARFYLQFPTDPGIRAGYRRLDSDGFQAYTTTPLTTPTPLMVVSVVHDWANDTGRLYLNGVEKVNDALATSPGNTSDTASSQQPDIGANGFDGDIGEIIVYPNQAHGTTDRQAVENYLMNRWGIS